MTPTELRDAAAVMLAAAEGKPIEMACLRGERTWHASSNPAWNWNDFVYRIKSDEPAEKSLGQIAAGACVTESCSWEDNRNKQLWNNVAEAVEAEVLRRQSEETASLKQRLADEQKALAVSKQCNDDLRLIHQRNWHERDALRQENEKLKARPLTFDFSDWDLQRLAFEYRQAGRFPFEPSQVALSDAIVTELRLREERLSRQG